MPESPEARTVADKLRPYLVSRIITNVYTGERAKTLGFHNLKCPATIIGVRSYGKKVLIDLDSGHMMITSLGMGGRFQTNRGDHSHIRFDISQIEIKGLFRIIKPSFSLFFDDSRYMGGIDIISNTEIPIYFKDLGPDLLQLALNETTWISLDNWMRIFMNGSKRMICDVLTDQSLVAGIGWYLMTDILYYSGIHPERRANTLTADDWDRTRINSHKVISLSYSYGGFTIRDFISPDGSPGLYPAAIYGKIKDPLGNPIIDKKLKNGRTIHFVQSVQV